MIPRMTTARALYSMVTWAAQPLLRRKLRRRAAAEPGYAVAVGERFGRYPQPIDSLVLHSSTDPWASSSGSMPCRWARHAQRPFC